MMYDIEREARMTRERSQRIAITVFIELACLIIGGYLLSDVYGWKTGVAASMLAYVAMPTKS